MSPQLVLVLLIISASVFATTVRADCTPIASGAPGSTPIDGGVAILKGGDWYHLFESWAAPSAGLELVSYTSDAIDVFKGAGIVVGVVIELFSGTVVYNGATGACWNVQGNYCFPDGKLISYGCEWGLFTTVNFKFGVSEPDSDGWSQIGAEPCGVAYCLYVGPEGGDPLFTTDCDTNDDRQKFMFLPVGGADFLFINKSTMECLYFADDGIRTKTCNVDDSSQLFQWCDHVSQSCTQANAIFNPC